MKKIVFWSFLWAAILGVFNTLIFNPLNDKFPNISWLWTTLYFGIPFVACVVIILVSRNRNKK
ncbi:hypothetical protein GJI79_03115 [Lactococcus lactis subsp. cremoris]|uniref:Uncharacterized protein n=1 Tax=Lactococcus lactis subsp. cremoris TaxID=1359 RepID=A0AAJ6N3C6_LACLC|nr:hypothetical protein [Lactococcus cremoris]ARD92105.1 hypothetical protein LL158_1865 [Lactococcus cremoris]MRM68029.1 hypothetical protein [Lactococcus cremoris]QJD18757.1 hypothetical protein HG420_01220 [Lactococcus cremoris]QRZ30634.1 hypothetical protein LLB26_1864 [Lactococcus cremoris]UXV58419.1 hypothetical protein LLF72_09490 [Lactococcus cremoris]